MSFDLTWPKVAALTTVQAGAQTAIGALTSSDDWVQICRESGVSALVAFLGLVVAYKLPSLVATASVSVPAAAHQATLASAVSFAADADEARKT